MILFSVQFSIPGPLVGKNAQFLRLRKDKIGAGGRHRGIILTPDARAFKHRIIAHGLAARNSSSWPKDPYIPADVRITVQAHGTRHDAGAMTQIVKDSLEGIFYANDRIVSHGPETPSIRDGSEPHLIVTLELLAKRTADEAKKVRMKQEDERNARLRRKKKAL